MFELSHILPHIFGFSGLALIVAAWQFDKRETILALNSAAFIFFALELYLLGAVVGSIMMFTACIKTIIAIKTQHKAIVAIATLVSLSIAVSQYEYWYDALTMIASITGTFAFFSTKVKNMRLLAPIGTILWGIHNFMVGAWGQLIADIFILGSMAIGGWRHFRKSKQIP